MARTRKFNGTGRLVNRTTGRTLARARLVRSFWGQFVGLMGKAAEPGVALGLPGCAAVHTFGVPVPLDVVFCDQDGRVLRVAGSVGPWRVGAAARGAAMAWEARAGTLAPFVSPGDVLILEEV